MRLDWAMLADSARVRENVAFIIAGGITNVTRVQMPIPDPDGAIRQGQVVRFSLALSLAFVRAEFGLRHALQVKTSEPDGKVVADVSAQIELPAIPPIGQAGGGLSIPSEVTQLLAFDVQFEPQKVGPYSVDIFTNGQLAKQIGFNVM
jgi:hypothetical protein